MKYKFRTWNIDRVLKKNNGKQQTKVTLKSVANSLTKKKWLLAALSSSLVMVPVTIFVSQAVQLSPYKIDGKQFHSSNSAMNYVLSQAEVDPYKNEVGAKWRLITPDGVVKHFDSPEQLKDEVYSEKYISKVNVTTSMDLSKKADLANGKLSLTSEELASLLTSSDESINNTVRILKGSNDRVILDDGNGENEAYGSYFSPQQAYYFNDFYFNSKEQLLQYLLNEYLPNNQQKKEFNSFVVQAPNGAKSRPISTDNDKSLESTNYLSSFIQANSLEVIEYTNSKSGETLHITNDNFSKQLDNIDLSDIPYLHIGSNQGESLYIIDSDKNDDNNLLGPYFYKGVLDIGSFNNTKMWKKTNKIQSGLYVQSKIDSMIGSFFSSIINDDPVLNLMEASEDCTEPSLFRTPIIMENGMTIDQWFTWWLKTLNVNLYNEVMIANKTLLKGKKYNTFFKFPTLLSFLLQRIVSHNLGNELIDLVFYYFGIVADFIQDAIETAVLHDENILTGVDGTRFNFKSFFNVGQNEFNINSSMEQYLIRLKTNYPKLVAAMSTFIDTSNNLFLFAGLLPYNQSSLEPLRLQKILDEQTIKEITPSLENIYNVFSSTDLSTMLNHYVANSKDDYIKNVVGKLGKDEYEKALDELPTKNKNITVGTLLKGIAAQNNAHYQRVSTIIEEEIKEFMRTGIVLKEGYLYALHTPNLNFDRMEGFLNLVVSNPDIDVYKAYMAVALDIRMNKEKALTLNSFNNINEFDKNVTKLVFAHFGMNNVANAVSIGTALRELYDRTNVSTNVDNPYPVPTIDRHPFLNGSTDADFNAEFARYFADRTQVHTTSFSGDNSRWSNVTIFDSSLSEWSDFRDDASSSGINTIITSSREGYDASISDNVSQMAAMEPISNAERRNSNNFSIRESVDIAGDDDFIKNLQADPKWGNSKVFTKTKEIFTKVAENILPILGTGFLIAEMVFLITDLLRVDNIQDFYVFTTSDGTDFVWDGGRTVSRFFGASVETVNTLKGTDILPPIQITLPQVEEFYYFNSVRFYDSKELKYSYLKYILNSGEYKSEKFVKKFTFNRPSADGTYLYLYDSFDEMFEGILENLNITKKDESFDYSQIDKSSVYISSTNFAFSNGISTDSSNSNEVIAENIYDNIRATNIVKKPLIKDGLASFSSNNKFVIPGKVWTPSGIIDNSKYAAQYLIDNSANSMKENSNNGFEDLITEDDFLIKDKGQAENQSYWRLFNLFKSTFQLESKTILKTDYFGQSSAKYSFSDYNDNLSTVPLYIVNDALGSGKAYFDNSYLAERFLFKMFSFEKIVQFEWDATISYNGLFFSTKKEFNDWFVHWLPYQR